MPYLFELLKKIDASHYKSPMGVFHESNSKNFVPGPSQNTVPDSYSEQDIDHQLINTGNVDQGSNDATGDLDHGDTDVTSNNNTNNDNNNDNNSNAAIFVNDNTTKTNSKYNSYPNLINPGTPPISNILVPSNRQSTQIKLYSKMPYRHLKCDACDASDATDATSRKTETNQKQKPKKLACQKYPVSIVILKIPLHLT